LRFIRGLAGLQIVAALSALPSPAQNSSPPLPTKIEVTDDAGRRVSIPASVRRIVSLAPNLTEIVYALGAQDLLAGVTEFCDFPAEAKQKPRIGGAVNPSLEHIVALKPDLVLATKSLNRKETVDSLEQLGVPVYTSAANTVDEVLESIRRIANIVGARDSGEALAAQLRVRLNALQKRLEGRAPRRVLFIVWADPLISIGKQTFLADALRWAGAESVVDVPQEWPRLSMEEVVRLQPDVLVFADSHSEGPEKAAARARELASLPGWRILDAVRGRRVVMISDAINRPAPRLVDAIEELAHQLHPTAFEGKRETGNSKLETRPPISVVPDSESLYFGSPAQSPVLRFEISILKFTGDLVNLARNPHFPFSVFHFPLHLGGAR
jgi:iron complex transport system substrate-binding protein